MVPLEIEEPGSGASVHPHYDVTITSGQALMESCFVIMIDDIA